jgi:hypothetical protein
LHANERFVWIEQGNDLLPDLMLKAPNEGYRHCRYIFYSRNYGDLYCFTGMFGEYLT